LRPARRAAGARNATDITAGRPEEIHFLCRPGRVFHARSTGPPWKPAVASPPHLRSADPAARRQAVLLVLAGACLGALLIVVLERYRIPLRDWVLANPGTSAHRRQLVVVLLAVALFTPLLALGAYLWSLGGKAVRTREFPPRGVRVVRDAPVLTGNKAVSRGGLLQLLGLGCAIACAVMALLLWRLLSVLSF
jgi:hypothetical protein